MVGLMVTSSKRAYAIPRSAAPRAPVPVAVHCWPIPPQETLKHSSVSVSVGSLGPGAHKVRLSPLSVSGGYGFASKHDFAVPALLLGLLLCLWMWGVSSESLQHAVRPVLQHLPSFWGFSALGCGLSPHSHSSAPQLPL